MSNKILVIDDNEETLETLCFMARNMQMGEVVHFRNAAAAIQYIAEGNDISLIICDWNMPEKTGLDLLRQLRGEGNLIPFIMVTARNDIDSVLEARRHGVNLYISKPFSMNEFLQKVSWVVQSPLSTLNNLQFQD